ncbi:MAG TPA: M48 family metallopeptidase [Methylomirabilota bacterium]|nr:M48 family metallopeptidase [Methylomirabilota bacterium]
MASHASSFAGVASHPSLGEDARAGDLLIEQRCVTFLAEEVRAEMPLHQLRISSGGDDGEYVMFEHPQAPDWAFWTPDASILNHPTFQARADLRDQVGEVRIHREGLPRVMKVTLGLAAFIVLAAVICWTQSSRILRAFVSQLPIQWEEKLGDTVMAEFREEAELITNRVQLAYLERINAALQKGVGATPYKFRYHLMNETEANAFALPGGHIVVTTGLLRDAERSEQVAGVIAHELAHVTERHGMRTVVESLGPAFALTAVFRRDSAMARLAMVSAYVGIQRYSRDHEREADDKAFEYLTRANIDPKGLIEFFQQDAGGGGAPDFLSSHPPTKERIERLQAKVKAHSRKSGWTALPPLPKEAE